MSGPILEVDSLVAGHKGPVVGPVSFRLEDGEIVGLAGPNGAGKSTILGAIIGKIRIFSGSARRRPGIRVGIQGQAPVRLTEMPVTGRDFLHITGADRQPVPEALQPLLPRRLDLLSGGQYQLMNVWACLGCAAELVLLDEPTNNMDPRATTTLADVLHASREDGRGVLVISHEHEFLERVCTRLVEVQPSPSTTSSTRCSSSRSSTASCWPPCCRWWEPGSACGRSGWPPSASPRYRPLGWSSAPS